MRFGEALVDLLPREIDIRAVAEDAVICAKPLRENERVDSRPGMPASAVSIGKVTCFSTSTGESAGAISVDLHLVVGDVGHRVDRQLRERPHAETPPRQAQPARPANDVESKTR